MKENSALLIIDMQNVYLPGNEWACSQMNEVIKYIKEKINSFPKDQIFFTQHKASQTPQGQWKTYNKIYSKINSNEYLNDYIPELKQYITDENSFIKTGFSSLSNKSLIDKLNKFDTIYITGVIAECCVLSTIFSLIDLGKKIVYCDNGIAGKNEQNKNAVHKILEELSPLHVIFE